IGIDEAGIEAAIRVQPGDAGAELPADLGELSSDHDAAIWLYGDGPDRRIDAWINECLIHPAIGTQPTDATARNSVDLGEVSADQRLSIRLHGDGDHRSIDGWRIAVAHVLRRDGHRENQDKQGKP